MLESLRHTLERRTPDSILAVGAESFYVFYTRMLLRLARKYAPMDEADDLVQDVWVSVIEHAERLECAPESQLRHWFAKVVRHKAVDRIRKAQYRKAESFAPAAKLGTEPISNDADAAEILEARWRLSAVDAALEELRPGLGETNYRIIQGHWFEGLSHAEVAEKLGLTEKQVRLRQTRILKKLKARMQVYLGKEDDE
jgi:RNA polymerase sigma-70 factor (ECF subfamily)